MIYDVTQSPYNATGDGTTDDREAIQDAIDACGAAGGGIVYIPKGDYLLDSVSPVYSGMCLIVDDDNVFIRGDGIGLSKLKVGDNLNAGCINISLTGVVGGGLSDIEIDGNRANNTGGHGIRGGNDIDGWTCRNVFTHHNNGYGVGLQYTAGVSTATFKNMTFENLIIEDTGADGIDVKNSENGNVNNRLINVTVRRCGLRDDVTGQACIDLRGQWECVNITCQEFDITSNNCQAGIRFRPGETGDAHGLGGHYSTLTNFYVNSGDTSGETIGVYSNSYQVAISNGVVLNTKTGVEINQQENTVTNVLTRACNNGFITTDGGGITNGDRVMFTSCIARGNADSGFKIATDECVLSGVSARSNVHGINLRTGSSRTVIVGVSSSNSGNNLNVQSGGITYKAEELYT